MSLATGPSPLTVVWDEYGVTSHCHTTPDGYPHSFHDSRNINDIGVTCFAAPSKTGVGGHCPINYESGCCEGIILHSPWKIMVLTTNLHLWTISEGRKLIPLHGECLHFSGMGQAKSFNSYTILSDMFSNAECKNRRVSHADTRLLTLIWITGNGYKCLIHQKKLFQRDYYHLSNKAKSLKSNVYKWQDSKKRYLSLIKCINTKMLPLKQ